MRSLLAPKFVGHKKDISRKSNAIPWEEPEVALLGADAAIALGGRFDLGYLERENNHATMAAAPIGLEGCPLQNRDFFSHV